MAPLFLYLFYSYYRRSFHLRKAPRTRNQGKERLNHALQKNDTLVNGVPKSAAVKNEMSKKVE